MGWKAFDTLWRKLREGRVTSAKAERVVYVGVFFINAVQYWREQYNITESQNGSGWEGPQWAIWSYLPAQAGLSYSILHRIASR